MLSSSPLLKPDITRVSETEFINKFCSSENRQVFQGALYDVFRFARNSGAKEIFFGGSFITQKFSPGDIDILLVYEYDSLIPRATQSINYASINLDILFCSFESQKIFDASLALFGYDRFAVKRPIVRVNIDKESAFDDDYSFDVDSNIVNVVKAIYNNRKVINRSQHKGILVSIHGLYSKAEWNFDIAPIASSQGWIFAPYVYSGNTWGLLINRNKRQKTIDEFRDWIFDLGKRYEKYSSNISIVAHSYGTYLVGKYLEGFNEVPFNLNSLILTGSVLNKNFEWNRHLDDLRVGSILNIHSPNDRIIGKMPNCKYKKFIGIDPIFGNAGYGGFSASHERLFQKEIKNLTHINTIKPDVIETVWMPFLESNSVMLHVLKIKKFEDKSRSRAAKAS